MKKSRKRSGFLIYSYFKKITLKGVKREAKFYTRYVKRVPKGKGLHLGGDCFPVLKTFLSSPPTLAWLAKCRQIFSFMKSCWMSCTQKAAYKQAFQYDISFPMISAYHYLSIYSNFTPLASSLAFFFAWEWKKKLRRGAHRRRFSY